ncbi:MAG: purine-nucleoside phosphorylase, partial [Halarcobacter sp.]
MIICAGRNETFQFAETIGVGLVESAINLTRTCLFNKPDYFLFIGS